jgi:hypothetical protein
MEVKDKVTFEDHKGYSIEWGNATWTEKLEASKKSKSIRNRYTKEDGGFNVRGSSEVPWEDFKMMIEESIKRGHFSTEDLADILSTISDTLRPKK